MSILITGASGFLGFKLTKKLALDGRDVIAISRREIPDELKSLANLRWIVKDLNHIDCSRLDLPTLDAVIHLAGATSGRRMDEASFLLANELTTLKVLQATKKLSRRHIFASSQVVYGELSGLDINESFPIHPETSSYACSKVNAENWARCFYNLYGGEFVLLRFCGFVDGGGLVDHIIDQALINQPIELFSNGKVKRDYLHSDDGINALVDALEYGYVPGVHPINIGSGDRVSALEIATLVCKELGSLSKINLLDTPAPKADFVYDIEKARIVLGFRPESLLDSIRNHVKERHLQHISRKM